MEAPPTTKITGLDPSSDEAKKKKKPGGQKPGYQNTPIQETKRTRNQEKTSQHRAKSNRLNGNQPTAGEGVRQKQRRGEITRNPESGISNPLMHLIHP